MREFHALYLFLVSNVSLLQYVISQLHVHPPGQRHFKPPSPWRIYQISLKKKLIKYINLNLFIIF